MRKGIVFFVLLLCVFSVRAKGKYTYLDKYMSIVVKFSKSSSGSEILTIELKPLASVLIPNNNGCFSIDTNSITQGQFRNMDCPYYVINEFDFSSKYRYLSKDTVIVYDWEVPKNKTLDGFSFKVKYIPTTTKEYELKKKKITRMPDEKGKMVFYIKQEDEKILLNRAQLEIIPKYVR